MQVTTIQCDGCDKFETPMDIKFTRNVLIQIEPGFKIMNADLCTTCYKKLIACADPRKWTRTPEVRKAC